MDTAGTREVNKLGGGGGQRNSTLCEVDAGGHLRHSTGDSARRSATTQGDGQAGGRVGIYVYTSSYNRN